MKKHVLVEIINKNRRNKILLHELQVAEEKDIVFSESPGTHEYEWSGGCGSYGERLYFIQIKHPVLLCLESGASYSENGRVVWERQADPIGLQLSKLDAAAADVVVYYSWYDFNGEYRSPKWRYKILIAADIDECQRMLEKAEKAEL